MSGLLLVTFASARGESLREALTAAYLTNPALDAQRASLRATDEEVARANAGFRPTLSGKATTGLQDIRSQPFQSDTDGFLHPKNYSVQMSQPLFRGFRIVNTLNAAEAGVRAAREQLRLVENQTLLSAAAAYCDVLRDRDIVIARENSVRVLNEQLRVTKEQFAGGEVTPTDVSQAQARRATAVATLDLAKSNLVNSRANYEQVVGHPASYLKEEPPTEAYLPRSQEAALEIATSEHPSVVQAVYLEQQARHQVDLVWGELLPSVNLNSSYGRSYEPSPIVNKQDTTLLTGELTWQFWNGGEVEARVRQAKQTDVQRLRQIDLARKQVQTGVTQAWSTLVASRTAVQSDREAVEADERALAGVRVEYQMGQRTLLDVLNAEQELVNARVQLLTDRHNLAVAYYTLLQAIGRLTAVDLRLDTKVYDETAHYHEVKNKWVGITIEYADGRLEHVGSGAAPGSK
jgi:outer membrane protein